MSNAIHRTLLIVCLLGLCACGDRAAKAPSAEDAIRAEMMATWDKPDSPLVVDPIVVVGHHAIASWTQPALGGRALLRRSGEGWEVVLCAGDALLEPTTLAHAGIDDADAETLRSRLSAAEAGVAADRLALIRAFRGVVSMGEGAHDGQHP
jgi:hypothetical protein